MSDIPKHEGRPFMAVAQHDPRVVSTTKKLLEFFQQNQIELAVALASMAELLEAAKQQFNCEIRRYSDKDVPKVIKDEAQRALDNQVVN